MGQGLDPDLLQWLDGKFDALAHKMDESDRRASDSRKDVYRKLEEQGRTILDMQHRVVAVEKGFEDAKPTLAEFTNVKTHVRVARRIGLVLWVVGGALLAGAAWIVSRWDGISAAVKAFNGR